VKRGSKERKGKGEPLLHSEKRKQRKKGKR